MNNNLHESHWLRFEKDMGEIGLLKADESRHFMLTDMDYLMRGSTYYDYGDKQFDFKMV